MDLVPPALWVVTKRSQTVARQRKTRSEGGHAVFTAALDSMMKSLSPSSGAVGKAVSVVGYGRPRLMVVR